MKWSQLAELNVKPDTACAEARGGSLAELTAFNVGTMSGGNLAGAMVMGTQQPGFSRSLEAQRLAAAIERRDRKREKKYLAK